MQLLMTHAGVNCPTLLTRPAWDICRSTCGPAWVQYGPTSQRDPTACLNSRPWYTGLSSGPRCSGQHWQYVHLYTDQHAQQHVQACSKTSSSGVCQLPDGLVLEVKAAVSVSNLGSRADCQLRPCAVQLVPVRSRIHAWMLSGVGISSDQVQPKRLSRAYAAAYLRCYKPASTSLLLTM